MSSLQLSPSLTCERIDRGSMMEILQRGIVRDNLSGAANLGTGKNKPNDSNNNDLDQFSAKEGDCGNCGNCGRCEDCAVCSGDCIKR